MAGTCTGRNLVAAARRAPSADDEPTKEWTVDELMEWCLAKAQRAVTDEFEQQEAVLDQELEKGIHEIWDLHHQRVAEESGEEEQQKLKAAATEGVDGVKESHSPQQQQQQQQQQQTDRGENNTENQPPPLPPSDASIRSPSVGVSKHEFQKKPSAMAKESTGVANKGFSLSTTAAPEASSTGLRSLSSAASTGTRGIPVLSGASSSGLLTIQVDVIGGPHQSTGFHLCPKPRAPCCVGRSRGKKFQQRGISLHKDEEVSTTHGKFEIRLDHTTDSGNKVYKAYYTDTGSTNGTSFEGQQLPADEPLELFTGALLTMGRTVMEITLLQKQS